MKKTLVISAVFLTTASSITAQEHRDWEDPQVIGINKLPYHSTLQLPSRQAKCAELKSLDGEWRFMWNKDPWSRIEDFYRTDYDVSQWPTITVPGNWQMQGFGRPIYTNIPFPFQPDQPRVTSEPPKDWYAYDHRNPVGQYVTEFEVTPAMLTGNLILQFEGVHSAFYVWVNGECVGYSQNPMSPAEFDITEYVQPGSNRLAVEVYRWSDGSYLKDQDMWRLSGIYRSVALWTRPTTHIADYRVDADLSQDMRQAIVNADIAICNTSKKKTAPMYASLIFDGKEHKVPVGKIAAGDTTNVKIAFTLDNPKLWSAEKPNLYDYTVLLIDKSGREIERFDLVHDKS